MGTLKQISFMAGKIPLDAADCTLSSQDGVKNWPGQRNSGHDRCCRLYAQFSSQLGEKNVVFSEKMMRPWLLNEHTGVTK
jgi:hypothetical protein